MKKSTFTQPLHVHGKNGAVTGMIIVTMNYSVSEITVNNPSTHDQSKKSVPVHKIEGFINDKIHWKELDITSESLLLNEIERCKKQISADMIELANKEAAKTFLEKMKDLGF